MGVFKDLAKVVGCVTATVVAGPVIGATALAVSAADKMAEAKNENNQQDKSKKDSTK